MKKARSLTGRPNGFTLVETLLAAAFLASGSLVLTPAFMKAGELASGLERRYEAEILLGNLIAEKEESLSSSGELDTRDEKGNILFGSFPYDYEVKVASESAQGSLFRVTARVYWQDSSRRSSSRSALILK